jgi:hypothetical protein
MRARRCGTPQLGNWPTVSIGSTRDRADLLDSLRQAGAQDQAAALLRRDPAARAALDNRYGVARLLDRLREAGAEQQAAALAHRLPGAGLFEFCP